MLSYMLSNVLFDKMKVQANLVLKKVTGELSVAVLDKTDELATHGMVCAPS